MRKLMISFLVLFTTLLVTSVTTFALTEGEWEFQLLDNEVMITKYLGAGGDVVMPETIYGCPVTSISSNTFNDKKDELVSLKVSKNIKEIPKYLLQYADNLKSVDLPNGLIRIGVWAFNDCDALTEVVLPSTLEEYR